jgi:hypothetical protein
MVQVVVIPSFALLTFRYKRACGFSHSTLETTPVRVTVLFRSCVFWSE